ncbi:MAG: hypothetical protein PUF71_08715 [Firmicutes bacterium]|nr:hypothetical protein [Bacillota bacterium]
MKNQITIREAITEAEAAAFWEQLHIYFLRDIFPDPKDEDRDYFLGDEYHDAICKVHDRPGDFRGPLFSLFSVRPVSQSPRASDSALVRCTVPRG